MSGHGLQNHSVLFLAVPSARHLRHPQYLTESITFAASRTQLSLLVVIYSPLFEYAEFGGWTPVHHWKDIQRLLTHVYAEAARAAHSQDNILLSVDVVLKPPSWKDVPTSDSAKWNAVYALDVGTYYPSEQLQMQPYGISYR